MELVGNFDDIINNVERFKIENEEIIRRLSYFRHWYYFKDLDKFVPSKFLGYKNSNVDSYSMNYNKSMDGRVTVPHLMQWFIQANSGSTEYKGLFFKLIRQLEPFKKTPNKLAKIYIIRSNF